MNIVVPLEYSNILDFVNGKAIAQSCENNRWGVINEQGLIIIPFEYSVLENFIDGKAKAKKYSSWGVIDESGQTVISFEYEELEYVIGGKIKAKKSSGWGIISEKEEIILPFEYSHIGEFEIDKIKVVKNSEWGYVDFNGNELIEDILEIDKGIFRGKKCGLYGLTDSDNNTIIDFKYNEIKEFVNGYAKVRKNKNWGEVDTYGNVLICNEIELKKGILRGKKFGKYGLQTIDGIEILAFEYDEIGDFINGIAHASIDRKTLYVADNGETFKYSYLEPYSEGKALGFGDIDYGHGRYSIPKRRFNIIQSDCFKQYQIRVQINSYEDYGCFLELHDARGLLHISEIKKANKSLYDIGSLNEYVNVYIESVDVGQQRISFSLLPPKQKNEASNIKIHAIPKTSNLSDYINKDITGVITGIQNYGLFVKIEDGTNGLLHISKFKRRGVKIDKYIIGESIKVSVVSIDQERNRIELDFN
jgi:predicted RNA-binding protein with RPS1 domain